MPTLEWIGRKAVVNHDKEVPYHLLKCDSKLSVGESGSGNLLVQGDNLLALKALVPYYAGKVRCIYIDPPYNTGNENWVYNDAVNSPEIRAWLGKIVGKETEDLSRHDKWLCMMYPRLRLLRDFLRRDGVIFISIGKDEFGHLRLLCDEIFGPRNLVECFIWQVEGNVENQEDVTTTHEYILAYERTTGAARINVSVDPNVDDNSKLLRDFAENSLVKNGPKNPASIIELPVGFPSSVDALQLPKHGCAAKFVDEIQEGDRYIGRDLKGRYEVEYPIRIDDLVVQNGILTKPCRVFSGWSSARKLRRFLEIGCQSLVDDDGSRLHFFLSHTGVPTYRREQRKAHFVPTILRNMGTTERASNELERMGVQFDYPKPVPLIKYLLSLYSRPNDIVMDSFCGSGTTGHAVLDLNSKANAQLRFILVELDAKVAKETTTKRLGAVAKGYSTKRGRKDVTISGLGGDFRYCDLGQSLFDSGGQLRGEVRYSDLAQHVFFTETGEPLPKRTGGKAPLIGSIDETAYYLLFNGVLGDKTATGGNVLTGKILERLPKHNGPKVIFGEGCRLGKARLKRERITFKQIPYEIKVS